MTIEQICEKYNIKKYTINPDGTIDVNGDVWLFNKVLTELPLTFNKVSGIFSCTDNNLTTLKGSPKWVGGHFWCCNNKLTSLEFSPEYIGGDFICYSNNLTSLEFSPEYVGGHFRCSYNNLTSLEFSPEYVGGYFNCDNNKKLINPKGCSEKIGGVFYCFNTPLGSIFSNVDQHFLYAFNFNRIIKNDTINLKRLKYVMDLYDKPIDLEKIKKYYRIV